MKKAALVLTTLVAVAAPAVALAQQPADGTPPPDEPGAAEPTAPVEEAPPRTAPPAEPLPSVSAVPCPTSTTTITSSEVGALPLPVAPPPTRETITVRHSYRPNRPLLTMGSTMLIGSYAATAAATAVRNIRDADGDQSLYIPVAGPWMHLANSATTPLDTVLIAGSGVAQGAGVVISLLSLLVPEHVPAATIQAGGVTVQLTGASYGRGSAGVGAVGQF